MLRPDTEPATGPAIQAPPRAAAPTLVAAQSASSLGSAVTGFAMNVWVFQKTGSYSVFSVLTVVAALPALLLAPAAGVLVDRLDRRRVLLGGQAAGAILLLLVAATSSSGLLRPWLVGVLVFLVGALNTVTWPAVGAAVTVLARPEARARVNGLGETLAGVVTVAAPVLGAALFTLVGVTGVALFDAGSYVACHLLIRALRFPAAPKRPVPDGPRPSVYALFRADLAAGYRWLAGRRDLRRLLLFFVAVNVGLSVFTALYAPYVLSFASPRTLGLLLSLGGAGAVGGGLLFAAVGGPRHKEQGVLAGALLLGLCMTAFGMSRHVVVLGVAALLYGAGVPVLNASSQTIWQAEVPPRMQGRIFSLRRMIAWSLNPVAILLSVPLADHVVGPLVAHGTSAAARIWGTAGPGRYGLMASCCGALCVLVVLASVAAGWLRFPSAPPDPEQGPAMTP